MPKKKRLLLVQPTRHQPKTAFSRLPPLHRADLEGPLRVRFGAFARLCRMSAICAFETSVDVSCRREADIADRGRVRRSWADSARSGVASGMTGVHAKAAVPFERAIRFDEGGR